MAQIQRMPKISSHTSKLSVPHSIRAYAPYRRASANRFTACAPQLGVRHCQRMAQIQRMQKISSHTSKLSVPYSICAYAPYRSASANRFTACAQVRIDLLHARPSTLYCTHVPESRHRRGVIDIDELHDIEKHATSCPCTCGGMFTSNTMATFHEGETISIYYKQITRYQKEGQGGQEGTGVSHI